MFSHHKISVRAILLKNTGIQMLAHMLSIAVGLATTVILSRYLGVEKFGEFHYVFAFYYYFLALNDFGTQTIVVREASRNPKEASGIIATLLIYKLFLSLGLVAAAWKAIELLNFPYPLQESLKVYALILPVMALQLPQAIFQVVLKMEYPVIIGIVNKIAGLVLILFGVKGGQGIRYLVAAAVGTECISLVLIWIFSLRFFLPRFTFNAKLCLAILRSSFILGITGIFVAVINRTNFMMLERLSDSRELGLYAAAYRITNLLEAFPLMVMMTVYPLMSQYSVEAPDRLRLLYKKIMLGLTALAWPVGIGVTLLAPWLSRLVFGAAFDGAALRLQILVWASVFLYMAITGGNLLISTGREKTNLAILGLAAMANVFLNLLWIPPLGSIGAALASSVTFFLIFILTIFTTRSYFTPPHPPLSPSGRG